MSTMGPEEAKLVDYVVCHGRRVGTVEVLGVVCHKRDKRVHPVKITPVGIFEIPVSPVLVLRLDAHGLSERVQGILGCCILGCSVPAFHQQRIKTNKHHYSKHTHSTTPIQSKTDPTATPYPDSYSPATESRSPHSPASNPSNHSLRTHPQNSHNAPVP